jgi:hypothetical protein
MPRILIPLLIALLVGAMAVVAAVVVFSGDDENNQDESSSPTRSTATRTPSDGTDEPSETPDGNDKTTPPETPDGETPGPTQSVDRTPAPGGIPAVAPADQSAFLAQFADQTINYQDCAYDPSTLLTDCGDLGDYSIDPPPLGQADCSIGIVQSTAELIQCTTEEPRQSIYYDIQE